MVIPFLYGIYITLTDWQAGTTTKNFVGLRNYIQLVTDEVFRSTFFLTLKYTLFVTFFVTLFGFSLAILVTRGFKTSNMLRTLYFLPNLIGGIVLGFVWEFIFSRAFVQIGLSDWLLDENKAFYALVIVAVWKMTGYVMVIFIAGLQNIPQSLIEASDIDGASFIQKARHIIFPLIMPALTITLFFSLANSFRQYDINLALTGGGPYGSTELLALNIYKSAFEYLDFGYAQAKGVVFFLIVTCITVVQVSLTKKREVEL